MSPLPYFFCNSRSHAIPLFVSSNILLMDMLYFETVSTLMHDISNNSVPKNIQKLFNRSSNIHKYMIISYGQLILMYGALIVNKLFTLIYSIFSLYNK